MATSGSGMIEQLRSAIIPLRIGCAGWSLASKDSSEFPSEGSHLERYAQVFPCVEINSSFYRSHQERTYVRWAASVPDEFAFSVKMPRTITHELRLQQCEVPLRAFLQEVSALGGKLGCLLIQLPPSLALDVKVARSFFSLLRKCTQVPVACEPRHASWFTAKAASVMSDARIACVWADPPPVAGVEPHDDPELLYMRLHGSPQIYYSAYGDAVLDGMALRMRSTRERGKTVWCIFDNTARGEAVANGLSLMKQLRIAR
jgi:uncharacterized protein YecE (DUF72 family)